MACCAALTIALPIYRSAHSQPQPQPAKSTALSCPAANWPLWQDFNTRFIEPSGRVVDTSVPRLHSTSEGQSYAMFFALVAGDRASFDRVWRWSVANLSNGDISSRLPAWQWGRRDDNTWGVLDANAAADADVLFAYLLLEAARLWQEPAYRTDARMLMARIAADEVIVVPGLGQMLLPAPAGFTWRDDSGSYVRWRFNPSYSPTFMLNRLALESPDGPWQALAASATAMVQNTSPQGFVPDWAFYDQHTGFVIDPDKTDAGSYDAIRTYLWAGIGPAADVQLRQIRQALYGMVRAVAASQQPPEIVRTVRGSLQGVGPAGFSAALVPFLHAAGEDRLAVAQLRRAEDLLASQANQTRYYDHALSLFGLGWAEQRYRFTPSGKVRLRWGSKETLCR